MTNRALALDTLERFLPFVPRYAAERNFDRVGHGDVSQLSRWIRYRVISEEECVRAVLSAHSFSIAEKFVQELMWRTYWKGWLELRPGAWTSYLERVGVLRLEYGERAEYLSAVRGQTALSFFNDWVSELVTTGYLHNHTRMWFASVWIFTLRLPWQLGAEFMYRHLLDGDPASNTLSWRWVGGLQTKGKIYVARPDNIAKYSEGRWAPKESELNLNPDPLEDDSVGEPRPLESLTDSLQAPVRCMLLHDDDLSADLALGGATSEISFCALATEDCDRSAIVNEFLSLVRGDALERTGGVSASNAETIAGWVSRRGEAVVHAMFPRCGREALLLERLRSDLRGYGTELVFLRRAWDARYFPKAKAGYFPFWSSVKKELSRDR